MTEMTKNEELSFSDLGLAEKLLAVLNQLGLTVPTPIQVKSIPVALEGKDLVGIAQTGTGKTLAFGLPLLQRLAIVKGRGLILLPTRELALQVDEHLKRVGSGLGLRTAVLIGGENIKKQFTDLKRMPHVIIGTPGRINDHLDRNSIHLDDVKFLVLDEADLMLDMGFAPQIDRIIKKIPTERQTMLFSATMPSEIVRMAEKYMRSPLRIEVAPSGKTAENVDQEIIILHPEEKFDQLEKLLSEHKGSVLIFCRTKHGVRKLTKRISLSGHKAAEIHSNRSLEQRRHALAGFKSGQYRILVATDIAARGIDVSGIELVLNFDLPDETSDYVHRVGRTARAGKSGKAVSFAGPDQIREIRQIEKLIQKTLPLVKLAEFKEPGALGMAPGHKKSFGYQGKSFGGRHFSGSFSFKKRGPSKSFDRRPQRDFGGRKEQPSQPRLSKDRDFKFIEEDFSETPRRPRYQGSDRPERGFGRDRQMGKPFRRFGGKGPSRGARADFPGRTERTLTDKERFRASLRDPEDDKFKAKRGFRSRSR